MFLATGLLIQQSDTQAVKPRTPTTIVWSRNTGSDTDLRGTRRDRENCSNLGPIRCTGYGVVRLGGVKPKHLALGLVPALDTDPRRTIQVFSFDPAAQLICFAFFTARNCFGPVVGDLLVRMREVDRDRDRTIARIGDLIVPLEIHELFCVRQYCRVPIARRLLKLRLGLKTSTDQ